MTGKKAGRPRSEEARQAVLGAVADMLRTDEARELSMEGIAKRAGVGKQTIYRWWPSKADIVFELLLEVAAHEIGIPDTGSLRNDLLQFVARTVAAINAKSGPSLKYLMAEAQRDASFQERFRTGFINKRRLELKSIFRRHPETATLAEDTLDLMADVIYGPIWYRLLVAHLPMGATFVDAVCTLALAHARAE